MFEDGPPPLPEAPPPLKESSTDGTFADLNDENRLTAVADDDYDGCCTERSAHISPRLPCERDLELLESAYSRTPVSPGTPYVRALTETDETADPKTSLFSEKLSCKGTAAEDENRSSQSPPTPPPPSSTPNVAQISKHCDSVPQFLELFGSRSLSKTAVAPSTSDQEAVSGTSTPADTSSASVPPVIVESVNQETPMTGSSIVNEASEIDEVTVTPAEAEENRTDNKSEMLCVDSNGKNERTEVVRTSNGSAIELADGDDDNDEFGDFEEFVGADTEHEHNDDNNSWANFDTASMSVSSTKDENATNYVTASERESVFPTPTTPSLSTLHESLDDSQLWLTSDADDEISDEQAIPDSGIYESLCEPLKNTNEKRPDKTVWVAVSIIEEALALKLQWQESAVRINFLDSLNVDAKKAVSRNFGLPVFAQQLEESAILAPVSAVEKRDKMSVGAKNSLSQLNSSEFLPRTSMERSTTINQQQQQPPRSVTVDSLAVPPAQFDWNNSGLTNPLKTGSISVASAVLDLDFLATTKGAAGDGPSSAHVFSTLQKDLAAFGLNSAEDSEQNKTSKDASSNKPDILNSLMKKNAEKRKYTPVSELSLDARALHDQLPDLDYMLSNILLFPVVNR